MIKPIDNSIIPVITKNKLNANIKYLMVFGVSPSCIFAVRRRRITFGGSAHFSRASGSKSCALSKARATNDTARSREREKYDEKGPLKLERAFRPVAPMCMCLPSATHARAHTYTRADARTRARYGKRDGERTG